MAVNVHALAAGGAIPGIGGLIGLRQFEKASGLRNELLAVTWLFATTVGVSILLWNRSFLGLWVGSQNYAGTWVNLLIVFIMEDGVRPQRRLHHRIGAPASPAS